MIEAHPNNKQARLEHIPICGTALHPDGVKVLHLADARMKLKEYSCVNVRKVHLVPRQHLVPYDRDRIYKLHKDSLMILREAINHLPHTKNTGGKYGQHGIDCGSDSGIKGQKETTVFAFTQHNVGKKKHKAASPAPVVSNGKEARVPAPDNQGPANGTGPGRGPRDDIPDGGRDEGGNADNMQPRPSQGLVAGNREEPTGSSFKPGKARHRAMGGSRRTSSSLQSSPVIQRPLPLNQHAEIGNDSVPGPVDHNATGSGPEELSGTESESERPYIKAVSARQEPDPVIQTQHPEGSNWDMVLWCLPACLFLFWAAYFGLWAAGP